MKKINLTISIFIVMISLTMISADAVSNFNPQDYEHASEFWSDEMYSQYTFDTFTQYQPFNEQIDFDNIDYALLSAAILYESSRWRESATSNTPNPGGQDLNLEPFGYCKSCRLASQLHAADMVENNFFAHENSINSERRTTRNRLNLFDYNPSICAENIAIDFAINYSGDVGFIPPDEYGGDFYTYPEQELIEPHTYLSFAQSVVNGWIHSPVHRFNLLHEELVNMGAACQFFQDENAYGIQKFKCVQVFSD